MKQAWSLLIGRPGPLRNGLVYLLKSMVQVNEVNHVDDIPSALHSSDEPCPRLVLLVAEPSSDRLDEELERLRRKWPLSRYIVMVDDEPGFQMAQSAGADRVLFKGCRTSLLVEAVEQAQE